MLLTFSLVLTLVVYVCEHVIMTRKYRLESSWQNLLGASPSARTDIAYFLFYQFGYRWLGFVVNLLCGVGVLYLVLSIALARVEWEGILPNAVTSRPIIAAGLMMVVVDFTLYFTHRALHAVPFLWNVHKLHHAALEMNIANGARRPLTEVFFQDLATFIVLFFLFGPQSPGVVVSALFVRGVIDKIQHSDLPWDYGLVGKLVASPRFHRLHHSADPADHNQHFSDIFSCWDYLFGTVSARYRADPSLASSCEVGLGADPEAARLNRGPGALVHATLPFQISQTLGFLRKELTNRLLAARAIR
jgi:sterol desaturase/sphingolipid hydroxylase (fatty acid hydroxylase superfamily)